MSTLVVENVTMQTEVIAKTKIPADAGQRGRKPSKWYEMRDQVLALELDEALKLSFETRWNLMQAQSGVGMLRSRCSRCKYHPRAGRKLHTRSEIINNGSGDEYNLYIYWEQVNVN